MYTRCSIVLFVKWETPSSSSQPFNIAMALTPHHLNSAMRGVPIRQRLRLYPARRLKVVQIVDNPSMVKFDERFGALSIDSLPSHP